MEWIYDDPIESKTEKILYAFLVLQTKNRYLSKKIVRFLSLFTFLQTAGVSSPEEIEKIAFYDKEKTKPIFGEKSSKAIFKLLKKKVGGSDEAKLMDKAVRSMLIYGQEWLPEVVTNFSNNAYSYITLLKNLRGTPLEPYIGLVKTIATETATSSAIGIDEIATDTAGPIGSAIATAPIAVLVFFAVMLHIADDELGEAAVAMFLVVPFIRGLLFKTLHSLGKVARTASTYRMFYPEFVQEYIPHMNGGKRFSTLRQKKTKWRQTKSKTR